MELSRLRTDFLCHYIPVYVFPFLTPLSSLAHTFYTVGAIFFAPTHTDCISYAELASFSKDIFMIHFVMLTRQKKISSGYRDIISNNFLGKVFYSEKSSKV